MESGVVIRNAVRGTPVHDSLAGILAVGNIRQNLVFAFGCNGPSTPLAAGVLYPLAGWLLRPLIAGLAMSFRPSP